MGVDGAGRAVRGAGRSGMGRGAVGGVDTPKQGVLLAYGSVLARRA